MRTLVVIALCLIAGLALAGYDELWMMAAGSPQLRRQVAASAWSPTDISDCMAWWDATYQVQVSGTNCTNWIDRVSSITASSSVASNQPSLSSEAINGRDALLFGGDILTLSSALQTTNATYFLVFTRPAAGITSWVLARRDSAAGPYAPLWYSEDNNTYIGGSTGYRPPLSANTSTGTFCMVISFSGSSDANTLLRINGADVGLGAAQSQSYTAGVDAIGGRDLLDDANLHTGYICEIIAYNRPLLTNEIAEVESEMMSKWGIQ